MYSSSNKQIMRPIIVFLIFIFITITQQVNILVVDDFTEGALQVLMNVQTDVDPSAPVSNSTFYVSPQGSASKSILGGERDLEFTVTSSVKGEIFLTSIEPSNSDGIWVTSTPKSGSGYATMQYDGLDGGSMSINTTGLVGVDGNTDGLDLTSGGRAIGFIMTFAVDISTDIQFNVYSPDGSQCSLTVSVVEGQIQQFIVLIFSSFSGNCDFTKVGAIELIADAVEYVDILIDSLDTYGNDVGDIVIDNFTEGDISIVMVLQVPVSSSGPSVSNSTYYVSPKGVDSPSLLGGERDLQLTVSSSEAGRVFSSYVNTSPDGGWVVATPNGATGYSTMQYDGLDKGSMKVNVSGLIGVGGNTDGFDLTHGGIYSGLMLEVESDLNTLISLNVYSPDGSLCTTNIQIPPTTEKESTTVPFNFFSGNCNFSLVGAIELIVDAVQNVDVIISSFTTHV